MLTKIHNSTFPIFFQGDELKYVNSRGLKNFADLDTNIETHVRKIKANNPDSEIEVVFYSVENVFNGKLSLNLDGTQSFLMARYNYVDVSVGPIYIVDSHDNVILDSIRYYKYKLYNPNESERNNPDEFQGKHVVWFQPVSYNENLKHKIGWSNNLSRITDENLIKQLELELIKKIVNEQKETA